MNNWISVNSHMPENGQEVMCFTENGVRCYFCDGIGKVCTKCYDSEKRYIFVLKPFTKESIG